MFCLAFPKKVTRRHRPCCTISKPSHLLQPAQCLQRQIRRHRSPQKGMGHLSNELWIPLTSVVCTTTSQKEAFTYKAHISQMNPHFTSNHNPGFFSFLILSPTCLFPSSSPNKNSSLETDSLLISHLTNKLIMFSYFSCLF